MTVQSGSDAHGAFGHFDPSYTDSSSSDRSAHDAGDSDGQSANPRSGDDRSSGADAFDDGAPSPDESASDSAADAAAPSGESGAVRKKRRRGSRGGRRRRGKQASGEHTAATLVEPGVASEAVEQEFIAPDEDGLSDLGDPVGASGPETASGDVGAVRKKRRRGRRRGRGRGGEANGDGPVSAPRFDDPGERAPSRSSGAVPREIDAHDDDQGVHADDAGLQTAAHEAGDEAVDPGRKKRRRRGSRGGRRRKEKHGIAPVRPHDEPVELEAIPGEDDDLPERVDTAPSVRATAPLAEPARGRGSKRKRAEKRPAPEDPDADDALLPTIPESERTSLILVNATDPEEQRVAVVENGQIIDFQMTVKDQDSLVNDIYRGRVVNLEPAIGAAFIDFGQGRNGFLHTSDVLSVYGDKSWSLDKLLSTQIDPDEWDSGDAPAPADSDLEGDDQEGHDSKAPAKKRGAPPAAGRRRFRARPRLPITDLLKKGQMVVVQVTKDAIGDKGPTLTTYISIPGRYLVLMPSMSRTGVSRKIEDEKERRRLKRILQSLDVPQGMGVIVRTAGVGHTKAEIKRDLDYLRGAWEAFGKKLSHGHGPAPLYRESDVAIRTMRDLFTPTTKAVLVDDFEVHRHIVEFAEKLMPEDVARVQHHEGPRPLFQTHGIEPDFEKIFARRIELPSGGSVVFDQAEALVAIDVNSGRTRSDGFDFEEIALKTNIEAAPEIARQIRLRDLGGIIVCDFIDMMKMSNIRAVEKCFKEALSQDRARSKLGRISQFGLLEMTRQRLGPGMSKKVFHTCPRCRGTGRIRTVNSRAAAILRRLAAALTLKGFQTVEVRAHPEVVAYLKRDCSELLRALEYRFQREVNLIEVPDQAEDSVLRYLRSDGKEVRPGGRRKR